jgi:hypothetical protein
MITGAIQIAFQPFVWSVLLASLQTLNVLLTFLTEDPKPLMMVCPGLILACLWGAVVPMVRANRLMRQHPDLYVTHTILGTKHKRSRGTSARTKKHHSGLIQKEAARRAWVRCGIGIALVYVASFGGAWAAKNQLRPADLGTSVVEFRNAWNGGDVDSLADLFPRKDRVSKKEWWTTVARNRGWSPSWPQIDEEAFEEGEGTAVAEYGLVGGEVIGTSWALDGQAWRLVQVRLPLLPIDDRLEEFAAAWHRSDPDAVARFFAEGSYDRMRAALRRMADRHDWNDEYPTLEDYEAIATRHDVIEVWFETKDGRLMVRWRLNDADEWRVTGLKPPSR